MEKVLIHDISYYQGDLSSYWQLFKDKGCRGIIIQSSNGLAYQNYYKETIRIAKDFGFLVGSYHYYRQHINNREGSWIPCSPIRQAENYYNWTQKAMVELDFPPVLDVENGGNPQGVGYSGVNSCLQHIERLFGRTPMIYSSPSILNGLAREGWERYPLWLAHYTTEDKIFIPKPWKNWTMWQFSDRITYTPAGSTLKKPIDHNWFNGSMDELVDFLGISGSYPSITPSVSVSQKDITSLKIQINNVIDKSITIASTTRGTEADIESIKTQVSNVIDEWVSHLNHL